MLNFVLIILLGVILIMGGQLSRFRMRTIIYISLLIWMCVFLKTITSIGYKQDSDPIIEIYHAIFATNSALIKGIDEFTKEMFILSNEMSKFTLHVLGFTTSTVIQYGAVIISLFVCSLAISVAIGKWSKIRAMVLEVSKGD